MLTSTLLSDPRLQPLLNSTSIVLLQLFVVRVRDKNSNTDEYKIAYGWVIKSARQKSDNKLHCSDASTIHSSPDVNYSIFKVSLYNSPHLITGLLNQLTGGQSLKLACEEITIDHSALKFDVMISDKSYVVRPLILNEAASFISRNPHYKNNFTSPYKNVPSCSLTICNLDKMGVLQTKDKVPYPEWETGVLNILKALSTETGLRFDTSEAGRFGNIELINSQCSDEYENHCVRFETIKETDSKGQATTCNKVQVIIDSNSYTQGKNLIVNCSVLNGDQVILDDNKLVFHNEGEELQVLFESSEPISSISVKVWLQEDSIFRVWYNCSAVLVRSMQTNIGIIGFDGVVKSEWLQTIENSNNKSKPSVREAEKVSRGSYNKMLIETYQSDPWVNAERNFQDLINRLTPKKSNGEFFPNGWDQENIHGVVSFLGWFKKVTDRCTKVVIQDPFFDTLGLEFLARTTNSQTTFIIITCTQVASNDDSSSDDGSEPTRI